MTDDEIDKWIEKALQDDRLLPMEIDEPEPEQGPPLATSELLAGRANLSVWQPTQRFREATRLLCSRSQRSEFFSRPQLKFLHDAYVLAEFIRLVPVESVRLADLSERWPDGFVKLQGQAHNIEVTSTHGGRKLGAEHKDDFLRGDPVSEWVKRADSIPKYLDKAIREKLEKCYSEPYWLVVYLNINELGIRQRETVKVIAETKARYLESFEAISILWKGQLY